VANRLKNSSNEVKDKKMANDGTIRIHRSIGGSGAAFRVTFAPYDTDAEGAAGVRAFHEVQQVRAFLKSLGLNAQLIGDALRQLAAGRSASVPNVTLSESAVRSSGLITGESVARR
jgi:hypothetical protein